MANPEPADAWRPLVVEMLRSGAPAKHWALQRGLKHQTFSYHVRRLWRDEPELFVLTARLCPCPLMAKLLPYGNPRVRDMLKRAYFDIAGQGGAQRAKAAIEHVRRLLSPASGPRDVGIAFLQSLAGESTPEALRAIVLASVDSVCHDDGPFFAWARENEASLRTFRTANSALMSAIADEGYERMRFVKLVGDKEALVCYDATGSFCIEALDGFLASRDRFTFYEILFFARFEESLGFSPSSLDDFTVAAFDRQVTWFSDEFSGMKRICATRMVRLFYAHLVGLLPADQRAFTFATGLPPRALGCTRLVQRWVEGYRPVVYEPLDPPPATAKWLLYPNDTEARKASFRADDPKPVDCSVEDRSLERTLVEWVWEGRLGSAAVRTAPAWIKVLLQKVIDHDDLSVIAAGGASTQLVRPECVNAALLVLAKTNGRRKMTEIKGKIASFLRFSEKKGSLSVSPACYLLLENECGSTTRDGSAMADPISEESLAALSDELRRMGARSVGDELTYIVFVTTALTRIRPREILSLRASDLDAPCAMGCKGVLVCRKSGGYDYETVEVPEEVHRMLESAVRITEPVRAGADGSIAGYVFLIDGAGGTPRVLSSATCDDRIAAACDRLGIPRVTMGDVRRSYETTVIMKGAERNWSRMMLRRITGHARVKSDEPYIALDIMDPETRRYLEGAYVVEIGNPRIRGEVLLDEDVEGDAAQLVERGAGVCRNAECEVVGTLPCFECSSFATAPRFIPEMVEAIAVLDRQIGESSLHQREHLISAKRHYLAYLGVMIDMEKKGGGR